MPQPQVHDHVPPPLYLLRPPSISTTPNTPTGRTSKHPPMTNLKAHLDTLAPSQRSSAAIQSAANDAEWTSRPTVPSHAATTFYSGLNTAAGALDSASPSEKQKGRARLAASCNFQSCKPLISLPHGQMRILSDWEIRPWC